MCGPASFSYMWFKFCLYWSTDWYPWSQDMRQLFRVPGSHDFSSDSNTTIHLDEGLKLTGAKRGRELMPFIPNVKSFFYFTLLVSWECIFWPLSGLCMNSTAPALWNPDWTLSSVCRLSFLSQFWRTHQNQRSELHRGPSLLGIHPCSSSSSHVITLPAKLCLGPQEATQNPWHWILSPS